MRFRWSASLPRTDPRAPSRDPSRQQRLGITVGLLGKPPNRNPAGTYSAATFARNGIPWNFDMLKGGAYAFYADQSGAKLIVSHHGHAGVFRGSLRNGTRFSGSNTCP